MKTTTIHNYYDDDDDDDDDEDDDAKNDNDDNDDDYAMMMTMTMIIILHNNQPDIDNDKEEWESVRRLREADGADRSQVSSWQMSWMTLWGIGEWRRDFWGYY